MKLFLKILVGMAVLLCTGCSLKPVKQYQRVDTAMGTVIKATVYAEESTGDVTENIRQRILALENDLLSWRKESSRIYAVNSQAGNEQGIALTEELGQILEKIWQVSEDSDGAFDVTIGKAVRLWNIDEYALNGAGLFRVPSAAEIADALNDTGYEKVRIESGYLYLPEKMELDLGAAGKGIACDYLLADLEETPGVMGAVISVGGSILTYGRKPDGSSWKIGITDPFSPSEYLGSLSLQGQWCVSTSGDYERYVEVDGVRYHHILDPATGYPAGAGLRSVTILSKDGCLSDALSTACFVLGEEKGLKLLEKYDAEAVMVREDGGLVLTPGMEKIFTQ